MVERNNIRLSNIELLRIVSMMLVLLRHYVLGRESGFSNSVSLFPTIINLELKSISIVCTHCFILVSGYFGIKFKIMSLANLLFQMFFWAIASILVAIIITGDFVFFTSIRSFGNSVVCGWFSKSYLILFMLSPILNSFIQLVPERKLGKYIIYFYLLSTIGGYLLGFSDFNEGMSVLSLCGLYLIGAYLRVSKLGIFAWKSKYDILIYIGLGLMMVVLNLVLLRMGISSSPYGYLNPIVILMAIYLFLFFKKIEIKQNQIINFFSASAFSVYLFHYNPFIYGYICKMWTWMNENFGVMSSLLVAFLSFIAIYLFCVVIDRIRILIYSRCIDRCLPN